MNRLRALFLLLTTASISAAELPPRLDDALPALRESRWQDAATLLETVIASNPHDSGALYYLGLSYQRLGRHEDAIDPLQSALELGVTGDTRGVRSGHLALARSRAATGDADGALLHLEEAWAHWGFDGLVDVLDDESFALLHGDPRLRALAGLEPKADSGDRDARWRADLAYLRRLLAVAHPDSFHSTGAASWNQAADWLEGRVSELTDLQMVSELMQLMAMIGDGHTALYPPSEGDLAWHLLPFLPFRLADGWFVAAASPDHADLVGAKLLSAGSRPWSEIAGFTGRHLARGNRFTHDWLAGVGLQFAEPYALAQGAPSTASPGPVELEVEFPDGSRVRRRLEPTMIDRDPNAHWAPAEWASAFDAAPRWLRDPHQRFDVDLLPETGVLYARLLQTLDEEELSLADFGRQVRESFGANNARALILDLRLNNGGNANQARGLFDELLRIPQLEEPGALIVLIGPRTFSATGYLLGMFQKHLDPLFVGWPSGCRPVGYSSERSFRLPYSGLTGSISHELRVDGYGTDDRRPAFMPDIPIWPTGADFRAGVDPVLQAAISAAGPA